MAKKRTPEQKHADAAAALALLRLACERVVKAGCRDGASARDVRLLAREMERAALDALLTPGPSAGPAGA